MASALDNIGAANFESRIPYKAALSHWITTLWRNCAPTLDDPVMGKRTCSRKRTRKLLELTRCRSPYQRSAIASSIHFLFSSETEIDTGNQPPRLLTSHQLPSRWLCHGNLASHFLLLVSRSASCFSRAAACDTCRVDSAVADVSAARSRYLTPSLGSSLNMPSIAYMAFCPLSESRLLNSMTFTSAERAGLPIWNRALTAGKRVAGVIGCISTVMSSLSQSNFL